MNSIGIDKIVRRSWIPTRGLVISLGALGLAAACVDSKEPAGGSGETPGALALAIAGDVQFAGVQFDVVSESDGSSMTRYVATRELGGALSADAFFTVRAGDYTATATIMLGLRRRRRSVLHPDAGRGWCLPHGFQAGQHVVRRRLDVQRRRDVPGGPMHRRRAADLRPGPRLRSRWLPEHRRMRHRTGRLQPGRHLHRRRAVERQPALHLRLRARLRGRRPDLRRHLRSDHRADGIRALRPRSSQRHGGHAFQPPERQGRPGGAAEGSGGPYLDRRGARLRRHGGSISQRRRASQPGGDILT